MSMKKAGIILLTSLSLAALIGGCSSSTKEGIGSLGSATTAGEDTLCIQCHSAVLDPLTNEGKVAQYVRSSPHKDSTHLGGLNGCEACHGGGAQHNGVGPIQYVNPYAGNGTRCADCHKGIYATNAPTKFADSKHANVVIEEGSSCRRCHTHEGAVLGATYGLTGDLSVMDNAAYQGAVPLAKEYTQFKCQTCHEHGGGLRPVKTRDAAGNIVNWNPSGSNLQNDQFNLCTSCHGLKTYDGKQVMGSGSATSGTVAVGHHETSWYRIIGSTHYNNSDNTVNGISGYVVRKNGEKPCFDCHAHEAKTNTNLNNPSSSTYNATNETIYTEWASSGHAGGLLKNKYAAATANPVDTTLSRTDPIRVAQGIAQVDAVTAANTKAEAWSHYDWSNGSTNAATNRQACQRCHTATGASNYMNGPAKYDKTKNDFSHLAGWSATAAAAPTATAPASKQREVLYCWGCHSNAGAGVIRNPGAITADYNFKGAKAVFPDVAQSNLCVACHSSMGANSGEAIAALPDAKMSNQPFLGPHYMAAAALMYVKLGFTAFIDPNTAIGTSTYGKTLTSTDDGGDIRSTHRIFGSAAMIGDHGITAADTAFLSGGPCVTCHMAGKHHTLEMDATAFNTICVKCHTKEGTTTLTAANFKAVFLEEQSAVFQDALALAKAKLAAAPYNLVYDSSVYPYFFPTSAPVPHQRADGVMDWTRGGALSAADARKLMGACFNINVLDREPGAFAHARTYTRRLLYDTIDFLDNGTIDMSVGATAIAYNPTLYVKGPTATDTATTEAYKYLAGYNRTTGAWNTLERP